MGTHALLVLEHVPGGNIRNHGSGSSDPLGTLKMPAAREVLRLPKRKSSLSTSGEQAKNTTITEIAQFLANHRTPEPIVAFQPPSEVAKRMPSQKLCKGVQEASRHG